MRYVLFSGEPVPRLYDRVSRALSQVDTGLEFGGNRKHDAADRTSCWPT